MLSFLFFFFFFFQAEDGIRDWSVTGVQTCALPIWSSSVGAFRNYSVEVAVGPQLAAELDHVTALRPARSEERRVGKECRSRWSPDHLKKKEKRQSEEQNDNDNIVAHIYRATIRTLI